MTLFDDLGGDAVIDACVDEFYKRILADPMVAPFFANTDMEAQHRHQKAFLKIAFGKPGKWLGRSMYRAHEGMGIEEQHFNAVAGHLAGALQHVGVAQDQIDRVLTVAGSLKDHVMGLRED